MGGKERRGESKEQEGGARKGGEDSGRPQKLGGRTKASKSQRRTCEVVQKPFEVARTPTRLRSHGGKWADMEDARYCTARRLPLVIAMSCRPVECCRRSKSFTLRTFPARWRRRRPKMPRGDTAPG